MSPTSPRPALEEVLDAFAMEQHPNGSTLEQYLRQFPEHATELIDLSRELALGLRQLEQPLSAEDHSLIEGAWRLHEAARPTSSNPLAQLSPADLRQVAQELDVPRQVITAFREGRVLLASVPSTFLDRMAGIARSLGERLSAVLPSPPVPAFSRSYKADSKPVVGAMVTFERILIDAGVSETKRARLLSGIA